jgi:hypothetical protein
VGLKVDFDMTLLVIASGLYRLLAKRMRGYADAQLVLLGQFRAVESNSAPI